MNAKVNITVKQKSVAIPKEYRALIRKACNATLKYEGFIDKAEINVTIVDDAEIQELPKLKAGSMVNCVLSEVTSSKPGAEITAVVAVAIGNELGCVVETSGIDKNPEELRNEAEFMVRYMMEKRDVDIREMIIESSTATVENIASVVASVVYLKDEIIEG